MRSGLSASKYIRNNKRTCFVLIIALALTFMAMYIVNYLLKVTEESFKPPLLELPKHVTYADLTPQALGIDPADYTAEDGSLSRDYRAAREKLIEELKKTEGVRDAYYTQTLNANYNAVLGMTGYEFPLVEPEKIPEFLEHMDAKLVEGRLPSGDGEILCDSEILKNLGLSMGDWFMEWAYGKAFKVVGSIENDYRACIGTPNGFNNTGWWIVVLTDEEHSDFRKLTEPLGVKLSELDNVDDRPGYEEFMRNEVISVTDSVNRVLLLVVMIFLAISVMVAYISFMRNRVGEYCLYASIGYSRREIYGMIMREMGIMFGTGLLLGGIFSLITMAILDPLLITSSGLVSSWWYPEQLLTITAAFAAVVGLLQIPILVTVHNIKTMDLMDD